MSAINSMWPSKSVQQQRDEEYAQKVQEQYDQLLMNKAQAAQNSVGVLTGAVAFNGSGMYTTIGAQHVPPIPLIPEKFELTWDEIKEGMWVAVSTSSRPHSHSRAFAVIRELHGKYYVMRELTGAMTPYDDLEMAKIYIESIHILEMN